MTDKPRFYLTTAIDYPNSRPHIGTAFEKLGADVQARYRRMAGYDVFFLMGNDENTIKVARRAQELGLDPKVYCDEMARQFQEVWRALDISFDAFIQTSDPLHHACCRRFIQTVYDNGYIYKGTYEGLYCEGCESFKTEKEIAESGGVCKDHGTVPIRRSEPCYYFALSKFQDRLKLFYEEYPDFIQPESRRNEVVNFVEGEMRDINISRLGQTWGIRIPFDEEYTIYVWFDALLNYITAIGYGADEECFKKWWPADMHFIGKDITRFHCALWPAMLMAAGLTPPQKVFGHGFVYFKGEKIRKTGGNAIEPMDIITQFGSEAFRYYFMRACPFPGDGDFSWENFQAVYNADLPNGLGNLYGRIAGVMTKNYPDGLDATADLEPGAVYTELSTQAVVEQVQQHIEACEYHLALTKIWQYVVTPGDQYIARMEPWKLIKTDREATKRVLHDGIEVLRCAAILVKPFLPRTAEKIYRSFNFPQPWEEVRYEDVWSRPHQAEDAKLLAPVDPVTKKVPPLLPKFE